MDAVNEKRTQALETYKKKSRKEEEKLQILLKKQYEADDLQEELGQVKGKLNQFEEQQVRLRKELTS